MKEQVLTENNFAIIEGCVSEGMEFSHSVLGENFYTFIVDCVRTSGFIDKVPCIISDRLYPDIESIEVGSYVSIKGQFRSYNKHIDDNLNKLILQLFVRELEFTDDQGDKNIIELKGFLCKRPTYRKTPMGREISEVLLAVNRNYNKSDYIPCICWGRNARYSETLDVGNEVFIKGRIQSREYTKKYEDGNMEVKIAYEISCSSIELLSE